MSERITKNDSKPGFVDTNTHTTVKKLVFTLPSGQHKALETYVHYLNTMHFVSYNEMKICSLFWQTS